MTSAERKERQRERKRRQRERARLGVEVARVELTVEEQELLSQFDTRLSSTDDPRQREVLQAGAIKKVLQSVSAAGDLYYEAPQKESGGAPRPRQAA